MMIPKEIEKYLVRDEIIEKEYSLTGHKAYASNKRLFIKRGNSIRDVDYNHISSIELKQERDKPWVVAAIVFLAISALTLQLGWGYWWAPGALGIMLLILGLIPKQSVRIGVVGLTYPLKLSGNGAELESLFRLVREKRT